MKKALLFLFLLPILAVAQKSSDTTKVYSKPLFKLTSTGDTLWAKHRHEIKTVAVPKSRNILKTNLSSLVFNNYNISYERHIYNKFSVMLSYSNMPMSGLPLGNIVKDAIKNGNGSLVDVNRMQMGGHAITPEIRFYAHKNMIGFYAAPYVRFASFDLTVPVQYNATSGGTKYADFSGKLTSVSGGVLFGVQHQLFKKLVLDIWVIGGHIGDTNGTLTANIALDKDEQTSLATNIDHLDATPFTVKRTAVTASSSAFTSDGAWVGFRGAGLTLGFRF